MADLTADFVRALDLHKERIRRLQDALCECPQRGFFQADLHDETCPVYVAVFTTDDGSAVVPESDFDRLPVVGSDKG